MSIDNISVWDIGPADGWDTFIRIQDSIDIDFLHALAGHQPIESFPHYRHHPNFDATRLGDAGFVNQFAPMFFSDRAIAIFMDSGQVIPMETTAGCYQLFHCTRAVDALDLNESEYEYDKLAKLRGKGDILYQVRKYVFIPDRLAGVSLFVLPNCIHTRIYCTNEFKTRFEEAGLSGFEFRKLWPADVIKYKKPRRPR
jgi:hypothetical protein